MRDFIEHWTLAGLKRLQGLQGLRADFLRLVKRMDDVLEKAAETQSHRSPVDRPLRRWTGDDAVV